MNDRPHSTVRRAKTTILTSGLLKPPYGDGFGKRWWKVATKRLHIHTNA
jgi:hypothetical protein